MTPIPLRWLWPVALATAPLSLLTFACSSSSDDATPPGSASVILTDSAADEIELFEVDVTGITLRRPSGATVTVLPGATRLDFAELESVGELVAGTALPLGRYSGVSMSIDFTNAAVCIVGQSNPATVLDENGAVLTGTVDVDITFATGMGPMVVTGRNHLFWLDLDLDQSLTVDAVNNQVTFSPVLLVSVDPLNNKRTRTTGFLTDVDTTGGTLTVERRTLTGAVIGSYLVETDAATVFQIDGAVTVGSAGLSALLAVSGSQPRVFLEGTVSATARRMLASTVETGLGTPGNGQDWLVGHVVARDAGAGADPTLTVLGRSFDASTGTVRFNTEHDVTAAFATTNVLRRGASSSLDTDAVQVGQHIAAFGTLTGTQLEATTNTGVLRLLRTSVFGTAQGPVSGERVTLQTARIDRLPIARFDFDVGGTTEIDPDALQVGVSGLSLPNITNGTLLRAIGGFGPVGVSGDEDFRATTVVDYSNRAQLLLCHWLPPNASAISAVSSSGITLDVANANLAVVGNGFAPITLTTSPAPTIQSIGIGLFTIVEAGALEVNFDFATFTDALQARLATTSVARVSARGTFDPGSQTMTALTATVVLR